MYLRWPIKNIFLKSRLVIFIFLYFSIAFFYKYECETKYTVVLDPGHGGASLEPVSVYGDKYDPVLKKYLIPYRQGASYKGIDEAFVVYKIALKVQYYLSLLESSSGREKFLQILKKYDPEINKIEGNGFNIILSRPESLPFINKTKSFKPDLSVDYNEPFRLYDMPHIKTGKRVKGIISLINDHQPYLVVSLHLTGEYTPGYGGMSSVISPGYNTFKLALDYINSSSVDRKSVEARYKRSYYSYDWFYPNSKRTIFEWFLCDSWIYFTGYQSLASGIKIDNKKFAGLRENYVSWSYDAGYWEGGAGLNADFIKSKMHPDDFTGAYWKREKSDPEAWRREGGQEGYGGDNYYASNEILRFVRKGLLANKIYSEEKLPVLRSPYVSTWSLPTYINAVNAFVELAFLKNNYDRERMTKYISVQSEAIAAGIYSLFYGTSNNNKKDFPAGNAVDFAKYENYSEGNYFKIVKKK